MPFTITITETKTVESNQRGEYKIIDRIPWTTDKLKKETMYQSPEEVFARNPLMEVWGYAPDQIVSITSENQILSQTVETLDIAAVIKAINNI